MEVKGKGPEPMKAAFVMGLSECDVGGGRNAWRILHSSCESPT